MLSSNHNLTNIFQRQSVPYDSSTSHSVDELVDYSERRSRPSDDSFDTVNPCAQKHVSFDSGDSQSKVRRSVTCGSAINQHMTSIGDSVGRPDQRDLSPRSNSMTSTSSVKRDKSPSVGRSLERLLGTALQLNNYH